MWPTVLSVSFLKSVFVSLLLYFQHLQYETKGQRQTWPLYLLELYFVLLLYAAQLRLGKRGTCSRHCTSCVYWNNDDFFVYLTHCQSRYVLSCRKLQLSTPDR